MTDPAALRVDHFRVAMGDTDAAQLIYFGAPVRWAERLLSGYLADSGTPTSQLLLGGFGLPAVELSVRYRSPLRLDDEVRAELRVQSRSERAVTWQCAFFAADATDAAVTVVLTQVSVDLRDGTPTAIALPEQLLKNLTDHTEMGEQRR